MAQEDNRVLRDYAMPQASGFTSSIVSPTIEANNFELNPVLISFVELDQFGGYLRTTPTRTFVNFLRSATLSNSMGYPPMLFNCGSSLSH